MAPSHFRPICLFFIATVTAIAGCSPTTDPRPTSSDPATMARPSTESSVQAPTRLPTRTETPQGQAEQPTLRGMDPGQYITICDYDSKESDQISTFIATLDGAVIRKFVAGSCESSLSPSGRYLAIARDTRSEGHAIFIRDLATGDETLVPGSDGCTHASWSPDEAWIASACDGNLSIHVISPDGSKHVALIDCFAGPAYMCGSDPSWSPSGQWLAFYQVTAPDPGWGLRLVDTACISDPESCPRTVLRIGAYNPPYAWSPSGDLLATSTFATDANRLRLVALHTPLTLHPLETEYPIGYPAHWAWSPDGQRLIVSTGTQTGDPGPLIITSSDGTAHSSLPLRPLFPQVTWLTIPPS